VNSAHIGLNNIIKTFQHSVKGRVTAVDDVSLEVGQGELLTLLGPSGCGKSTTLRMIAGFEVPDSGRVSIAGKDVTAVMPNRRNIGFVFQNYALFPHLNVFENVAYGLRVKGMSGGEIDHAVHEALDLVALPGYERQFPNQMSGGEQQRVALARAIVINPSVLLFDEPLSNLDAKLRVKTRGEIRRVQRSLGTTSIYVTHDQEEAMAISDRIAVMNQGRIEQVATAEELYFQPVSEFVAGFIGKVNKVGGIVESADTETATVTVFGHPYRISHPGLSLASKQTVDVLVRPQFVQIVPSVSEGHFAGTVVEKVFLGEKIEYTIKANTELLSVSSAQQFDRQIFNSQQVVGIVLHESTLRILDN